MPKGKYTRTPETLRKMSEAQRGKIAYNKEKLMPDEQKRKLSLAKTQPVEKRFWSKVKLGNPDECWEWQAGLTQAGYGKFWINGRTIGAHIVSYMLLTGDNPGNLFICHSCDNPRCVNPAHLWKGTQLDNVRDRDSKGRGNCGKGETSGQAKLTWNEVREIRKLFVPRTNSLDTLAKKFKVSRGLIWLIIRNKIWVENGRT